jgi:hypothetical protein
MQDCVGKGKRGWVWEKEKGMCTSLVVGIAEEEKNKLTLAILRYTNTLSAVSRATIAKPGASSLRWR